MAWWDELFAHPQYQQVFAGYTPQISAEEARWVRSILRLEAGDHLLDLCCGIGRHAVALAQQGLNVTGLDFQPDFLREAYRQAARQNVSVEWVEGDIRELAYRAEFDAAISMLTSYGYFDEERNREVLRRIARALRPGGRLLLDLKNRDEVLRNPRPQAWRKIDAQTHLLEAVVYDPLTGRVRSDWWFLGDGQTSHVHFDVRLYTLQEIERDLRGAGLAPRQVFGSLNGEKYDLDAPRMVVIAERSSG